MSNRELESHLAKIEFNGALEDISRAVSSGFNLGEFVSNVPVLLGYEDFNFSLSTTTGKYFVKVYSSARSDDECAGLIDVVSEALKAGARTPGLYTSDQGGQLHDLVLNGSNLRLCVLEHVDGEDLYTSGHKLTHDEIRDLTRQITLINGSSFRPQPTYDAWVAVNFLREFRKTKPYMSPEDLALVEQLVRVFEDLRVGELPYCFIHGDLGAPNVMKATDGGIWLVDFSSADYHPRIQELAIMATALLFNPDNESETEENFNVALDEYQRHIRLTDRELKALPSYLTLSHAMFVIAPTYIREVMNNHSQETDYWYQRGKIGLQQRLR